MKDPRVVAIGPDKFWQRVIPSEGCWLWGGSLMRSGYGQCQVKVGDEWTNITAHRIGYEMYVGPIPAGYDVDHLCRNRGCVRPDHLEAVTHAENLRRGRLARRADLDEALTPVEPAGSDQ